MAKSGGYFDILLVTCRCIGNASSV